MADRVQPTTVYFDYNGIAHKTEEMAQHANGRIVLAKELERQYPMITPIPFEDVIENIVSWYIIFLEAKQPPKVKE